MIIVRISKIDGMRLAIWNQVIVNVDKSKIDKNIKAY